MSAQLQPVLIDGQWRAAQQPVGSFAATSPGSGALLERHYPISERAEVLTAVEAGAAAAEVLRHTAPEQLAAFLERLAASIEAQAEQLVAIAERETGLPAQPRLRAIEIPRTVGQLRQAAQAARSRAWTRPIIDTQAELRALLGPLGAPVVIFGPNNFPFAFNAVGGGDFAAAIAAGNPVIAKAHPGHPHTTQLLAELALAALQAADLPAATVQLLYHMQPESGLALVAHPAIGASAFTGSRQAGLALKAAADSAGKPIYLELSSVNPVVLLPEALAERAEQLAEELFASCTLGSGQFCTNPGLVLMIAGPDAERFSAAAAQHFASGPAGLLLSDTVAHGIQAALAELTAHGAAVLAGGVPDEREPYRWPSTLLRVSGAQFLAEPAALQTEAFGPVALLVVLEDAAQLAAALRQLEGSLTGAIYSHSGGADDERYAQIEPLLRWKVGRLLNDRMPTGVAVSPAMHHGGPYPATGHPGFTSVGIPAALERFAMRWSYDHVRPTRLPPELRDDNPLNLWRLVDGHWTQARLG